MCSSVTKMRGDVPPHLLEEANYRYSDIRQKDISLPDGSPTMGLAVLGALTVDLSAYRQLHPLSFTPDPLFQIRTPFRRMSSWFPFPKLLDRNPDATIHGCSPPQSISDLCAVLQHEPRKMLLDEEAGINCFPDRPPNPYWDYESGYYPQASPFERHSELADVAYEDV